MNAHSDSNIDKLGPAIDEDGNEKSQRRGGSGSRRGNGGNNNSRRLSSRTLMDIHFETVLSLLRLSVNSIEKSMFLLISLTALMGITSLNNYLSIVKAVYASASSETTISLSSTAFSLMDSLRYFDVAQILQFVGAFSNWMTIIMAIYLIVQGFLLATCFTDKYMNPNSKPRKYFFGRWFVNLASYFIQLLSFPFAVVFLAFLDCTGSILEQDSIGSCEVNSDNVMRQATFSFSLIGLALLLAFEIWMQLFFYNAKMYKKDATSVEKDPVFLLEYSGFRLTIAIFTALTSPNSPSFFIAFLAIQSFYALFMYYRVNFTLAMYTFANPNFRAAFQHSMIFMLAESLAFVIDAVARESKVFSTPNERFLSIFICVWFALEVISPKLRERHTRYVLLKYSCGDKHLSPETFFLKIAMFQYLNSQTTNGNIFYDSLFKGFASEHFTVAACIHPSVNKETCFCKCKVLYDPKKRKDTPLDKIYLLQNNSVFTKFIVKSWFETYLSVRRTTSSYSSAASDAEALSIIAYSEFLYFKMKNVSLALKNLAYLESKQLSTLLIFKRFRLKQMILKHNRKRNHDSYRLNQSDKDNRNKLEIESVIPVEEQIAQIQTGIKFIIKNNIRFWAHLEKANVNLNEINSLARFSLRQLDLLKALWSDCLYYVDYRKKWRFYYCWYYLYILNRKIKVSMLDRFVGMVNVNENDVFSEELQQENVNDVGSVASNMKVDDMEKISIKKVEFAFDKKSVVFHVNSEHRGKIVKVNRAVFHTTGYTAEELMNSVYIQVLMPRIYANIHPVLMENFALTGKTKTLYSQRKVYCLNKQGHLFPVWKFVKQYVTLAGKCEYVAMLRPISPPAGTKIAYIILNDEWEIDSMSDTVYDVLGINALEYQQATSKMLLSLLVLSPKLMRFTKMARFLTESDYRQFLNRDLIEKAKAAAAAAAAAANQPTNGLTGVSAAIGGFIGLNGRVNMVSKIRRESRMNFEKEIQGFASESEIQMQSANQIQNEKPNALQKMFKSFHSMSHLQQQQQSQQQSGGMNANTNMLNMNNLVLNTGPVSIENNQITSSMINIVMPSINEPEAGPSPSTEAQAAAAARNMRKKRTVIQSSLMDVGKHEDPQQSGDSFPSDDDNNLMRRPRKLSGFSAEQAANGGATAVPNGGAKTNQQQLNTVTGNHLGGMSGFGHEESQLTSQRRDSASEIMDQLRMGGKYLQPNYIRDEMMKKKSAQNAGGFRKSFGNSGFGGMQSNNNNNNKNDNNNYDDDEEEYDDEDREGKDEINASDYEDESNPSLGADNSEENEAEFQKMDNLERGDSINFRLRVPFDLPKLLADYHARIAEIIHNRQMRNFDQALTSNLRTVKINNQQTTMVMKDNATSRVMTQSGDSRDKLTYYVIKDMIMEFQRKKPLKEINATCSASFKKNGKQKIIILKLTKFEEVVKKHRTIIKSYKDVNNPTNNLIPLGGNGGAGGGRESNSFLVPAPFAEDFKKNSQFNSALELLPHNMNSNQAERLNRFVSIRSELSDANMSVHTNSYLPFNNRFVGGGAAAGRNDNNNFSDTEDQYGMQNSNMNHHLAGLTPQQQLQHMHALQQQQQQYPLSNFVKDADMLKISKLNGMGYQMKMDSERDDIGLVSERSLKTFHKDFVNRQGARNISLSHSENIFIKEDNHKPNRSIQTITNLKLFVRLFFLLLVALNCFTYFYGPYYRFPVLLKQSNKVFQSKNVLLSALQSYNLMLDQVLTNEHYYDDAINLDPIWDDTNYQELITDQYNSECSYFYSISSDSDFKQTFFDKSLLPYEYIEKDMLETATASMQQEEYSIDSYDLFSAVVFSLKDVQNTSPQTISIDHSSIGFFRKNIFPSFYNGFTKLQQNLLNNLQSTGNQEYNFLIIIIIVESVLILASFIVLFRLIFVICNAFKSVIEVFPKISQRDLRKIKNYNMFMNMNFTYITEKDDMLSGCFSFLQNPVNAPANQTSGLNRGTAAGGGGGGGTNAGKNISENDGTEKARKKQIADFDLDEPNDGNENVGKKSKDVEDGGFLRSLRFRIVVLFLVFILFAVFFSAVFLYLVLQSITNLQLILDNGEVFMNTFGDNITLMIAVKEKTLDRTNYDANFKTAIQSIIDAYVQKNMQPYVESLSFMSFDDVFQSIFYGNPCSYLQELITSNHALVSECSSLAQNSLSKGVASFNSFYRNAILNFVNNGVDSDSLNLYTMFDYNRGIYFVDLFQVYLVQVWSSNTESYLNSQLSLITAFVLVMFIALCIVQIIVTERLLIGRFNNEYAYFRMVYNMYMPELIIIKEKRIKFWLIKHHIINK